MTKFLIVDDNEQNLYMLQVLLEGHGYQVVSAGDGAEALEKARRNPPDIIVTDILMPVMDGFTLCREWKRDDRLKEIPFVFYTATYTDPKDEEFALNLGAERFIVKPVELDVLVGMLREVMDEHEAGRLVAPREPLEEDEAVYLREYNEALVRKLEDKMMQLEETNRGLESEITERVRTEEALRQRTQQLDTLYAITAALSSSLALDEVLGLILELLAAVVPFDSGTIFLVEDDRLRCVMCQGLPHPEQVLGQLFPVDSDIFQKIQATKEPICLADAQANPRFQRWGGTDYVHGWLGVPMQVRGEMIGILTIDSRQLNVYGPARVALVQPFANQAAQAIENARLHEQVQRHAAELEQRVVERTAELQESENKSRAQYKGIPVPTYTWQRVGDNLVLVDYNDAAVEITQGGIADFVGVKVTEMYRDMPEIRDEIERCLFEKITIKREMSYQYRSTGESKHLAIKYAFVPPDLVLVHTEDITERVRAQKEIEKRAAELRKMVNLMAGREVRMVELKEVIRQLRAQLKASGLTPVADDPLLDSGNS